MSIYGPLVTPDEVLDLLLSVARDRTIRQEHLNVLERAKGLRPRTIPDFKTIGRLGDEGQREAQDWTPSLMFFLAGTSAPPELNEDDCFDFRWSIAAEVQYLAPVSNADPRADAIKGAWWYAMLAAQLLIQRTPRTGIVNRLRIVDMEAMPGGPSDRLQGVRFIVDAHVSDALALHGPPPFGAPDSQTDPYGAPPDWPAVTQLIPDVQRGPAQ